MKVVIVLFLARIFVNADQAKADSVYFNFSQLKSCSLTEQFSPSGTKCMTSKGYEFIRVEKGWKDITSNVVWFDDATMDINQYYANNICLEKGQRLPTGWPERSNGKYDFPNHDSDFVVAEKHGFREVLKDMKDRWFWSSTIHPTYSGTATYFDWDSADVVYSNRNDHFSIGGGRCVN